MLSKGRFGLTIHGMCRMLSLASLKSSNLGQRVCSLQEPSPGHWGQPEPPCPSRKNPSSPSLDAQTPEEEGEAPEGQWMVQSSCWQIQLEESSRDNERTRAQGRGTAQAAPDSPIPTLAHPGRNSSSTAQQDRPGKCPRAASPSPVPFGFLGTNDFQKNKKKKFNQKKKTKAHPKKTTPKPTPSPQQDILQVLKLTGPIISSTCG